MKHIHRNTMGQNQIQILMATPICFLLSTISGCSLTVPATLDSGGRASPVATEHPAAEDIWRALAHAVESKTIDTTTRLAQYVNVLVRNGELAENDVRAFDAAFPRIATDSRALTESDADALVKLGQTAKR